MYVWRNGAPHLVFQPRTRQRTTHGDGIPDPDLVHPSLWYSQTDPFTLSAWIMSQQHSVAPEARGRLTILLHAITVGCKFVASAVRKVR